MRAAWYERPGPASEVLEVPAPAIAPRAVAARQPPPTAVTRRTISATAVLSYVLSGEIGVRIGDRDYVAGPGSYVFKPRGIPHTFWNAGPPPARPLS